MLETGWISFEVALLLCIAVLVVVIIYAFSELLIALPLGNLSLALWLKQPPIVITVHSGHGCSNCLRVAASSVCSCLNVGCGCFNPPPPAPPPAALLRRLNRAEARLDALRRTHAALLEGQMGSEEMLEATSSLAGRSRGDTRTYRNNVATNTEQIMRQVSSDDLGTNANEQGTISIGVHHHVRWECLEAYEIWQKLMHKAMRESPGFISMRTVAPTAAEDGLEAGDTECVHSVIFRYASLDTLQAWLYSKAREDLLVQLQPLLYATDLYTAAMDRVLPDAFTDALYPANSEAPLRPPPKWKVCAITIASLFLVVYPVSLHVPDLLSKCGIKNTYGQIPITSAINVFLNTYTMNPLLMTVVGHWLAQPRPPFTDAQPWKLLDQGFGTSHCALALRFLVVVAYFVPLLASWAVNR